MYRPLALLTVLCLLALGHPAPRAWADGSAQQFVIVKKFKKDPDACKPVQGLPDLGLDNYVLPASIFADPPPTGPGPRAKHLQIPLQAAPEVPSAMPSKMSFLVHEIGEGDRKFYVVEVGTPDRPRVILEGSRVTEDTLAGSARIGDRIVATGTVTTSGPLWVTETLEVTVTSHKISDVASIVTLVRQALLAGQTRLGPSFAIGLGGGIGFVYRADVGRVLRISASMAPGVGDRRGKGTGVPVVGGAITFDY